ncbi:MAG: FimB/Mfa2 family fimbrial subunit [Bacteroidaceae bacterium]|nr:FimB/Mfa2 family fimbrial subunit [Bacteroidaceae bacterium]
MWRVVEYVILSACIIVLCACERVNFGVDNHKSKVVVSIDDFKLTHSDIGTRSDVEKERISFAVFDSTRTKVCEVKQVKGECDEYGQIITELDIGKYYFVAVGSHLDCNLLSPDSVEFLENNTGDVFCGVREVYVRDGEQIQLNMTLHRCVTQFRLVCEDGIPENIKSFRFDFYKGNHIVNPQTGLAPSADIHRMYFAPGTSENTLSCFFFLGSNNVKMDLTVTAIDYEGDEMKSRVFEDLNMEIGKCLTASGSFFISSQTLSVDFNTEWKKYEEIKY